MIAHEQRRERLSVACIHAHIIGDVLSESAVSLTRVRPAFNRHQRCGFGKVVSVCTGGDGLGIWARTSAAKRTLAMGHVCGRIERDSRPQRVGPKATGFFRRKRIHNRFRAHQSVRIPQQHCPAFKQSPRPSTRPTAKHRHLRQART